MGIVLFLLLKLSLHHPESLGILEPQKIIQQGAWPDSGRNQASFRSTGWGCWFGCSLQIYILIVLGCNFGFKNLNIIGELIRSPHFESGTFPKKRNKACPAKGIVRQDILIYQCQSLLTRDGSEAMLPTSTAKKNQAANQNKQYNRVGKLGYQYQSPTNGGKVTNFKKLVATMSHFKCYVYNFMLLHIIPPSKTPAKDARHSGRAACRNVILNQKSG